MRIGGGRCAELLVAPWQYSGQLPRPRADTSPDMFLSGLVLCFCGLGLVRVTWGPPRRLQRPTVSLGCAGTTCTFSGLRRYNLYLRFPPAVQLVPVLGGPGFIAPAASLEKGTSCTSAPGASTTCTFVALGKYKLYLPCAGKVQVVLAGVCALGRPGFAELSFCVVSRPPPPYPCPPRPHRASFPASTTLPLPPEHPTRLGGERELGSGEGRRAGGEAGQRERGNERRGGRARGEVDSSETQNP